MNQSTNSAVMKNLQRIFEIFKASDGEIRPHFILTGPSGSGKSHTVQYLADIMRLGVIEINAAQLTKEGTAGNSLSKALTPLLQYSNQPVVCFVDEFDKLFISGNSNSDLAHETTNGVQNEFLKVLESSTASVFGDYGKYLNVPCDQVLFVFAGAFNGEEDVDIPRLKEFGIKTEFLGRVGLSYALSKLSLDDLKNILINSPLLEKYLELFEDTSKEKVVTDIMLKITEDYDRNILGARMITTLLHQYFINGGLSQQTKKQTAFNKKLSLA